MAKKSKQKSTPVGGSADDHRNAHDFQRAPGPGPNDAGKGAVGREALDRIEGVPERTSREQEDEGGTDEASPDRAST
jgi:hypothetical protein